MSIDKNNGTGFESIESILEKIKSILFAVFGVKDHDAEPEIKDNKTKQEINKLDALLKKQGKSNFKSVKMSQKYLDEFIGLGYPDLKIFMKERGIE